MKTREEARRYAITYLLEEREEEPIPIPEDEAGQRVLLRSLINERRPLGVTSEFRHAQNIELLAQRAERGDVDWTEALPTTDRRLHIWQGDITRLKVDAIVNAANAQLLGCFIPMHRCIDNAIHSAAGVDLRLACADLMSEQRHPEPTGRAKITPGSHGGAHHSYPNAFATGAGTVGELLLFLLAVGGRARVRAGGFLLHLHGRVSLS